MILSLLKTLINNWNQHHYQPLLEADVAGWLLHTALCSDHFTQNGEQIHLDSRVLNAPGQRFDFVVGQICTPNRQRTCLSPRLVCEIKLFPSLGFNDQQHRVHFKQILDNDIRKLAGLTTKITERCSLIFDACGYLGGEYEKTNRREYIKQYRDINANGIKVFLLTHNKNTWCVKKI